MKRSEFDAGRVVDGYDEATSLQGMTNVSLAFRRAQLFLNPSLRYTTMGNLISKPFFCCVLLPLLTTALFASDGRGETVAGEGQLKTERNAKTQQTRKARNDPQVPPATISEAKYGEHARHVLDFWKADSDEPTPLAFVIHGGGWQGGTKERVGRFVDVEKLLDAGVSVVAINYRLISHARQDGVEPPVDAPLRDAARALQYVRHMADEWNIDPDRIGAAGGSAGACSSLWLAFHDDLADENSDDPVAAESTRLQCAAVIGAQTTLDPKQMKEWTPNSRYGAHAFGIKGGFQAFLDKRDEILPWIAEYSPYELVSPDDPPVYLFYSAPPAIGEDQKDPTHTSNFGVMLKRHCDQLGVKCDLVYPGAHQVTHRTTTDYLIDALNAGT